MKTCKCPAALRHGLARKEHLRAQDVDQRQLRMGTRVEREHTSSRCAAQCIALDHLAEIPDYYTRLAKMERAANRRK